MASSTTNRTGYTNSLTITNVQAANLGNYTLVISNAYGVATSEVATLSLREPPSIVVPPTNVTVGIGATATFNVVAAGGGPYSYRWYFNGTNTAPTWTTDTLTIPNAQPTDAGYYHVAVTNAMGWVISTLAMLTVDVGNTDSDGDGMLDWQEALAGTDPHDAQSYLKVEILSGPSAENATAVIQFQAVADKSYTVQYRDSLSEGGWLHLQDVSASASNRLLSLTDTNAPRPSRFYRLVTPQQP